MSVASKMLRKKVVLGVRLVRVRDFHEAFDEGLWADEWWRAGRLMLLRSMFTHGKYDEHTKSIWSLLWFDGDMPGQFNEFLEGAGK